MFGGKAAKCPDHLEECFLPAIARKYAEKVRREGVEAELRKVLASSPAALWYV